LIEIYLRDLFMLVEYNVAHVDSESVDFESRLGCATAVLFGKFCLTVKLLPALRAWVFRAVRHDTPYCTTDHESVPKMPPMTLNGVVTKAGFMNKTVTVTVSRFIAHKLTGKVRLPTSLELDCD
jgi:hypothetical protein